MRTILIVTVALASVAQFAISVYTLVELVRMKTQQEQVLQSIVMTPEADRFMSKEDIEAQYDAFTSGTHFCQLVCYGRMKSYTFTDKESRCVCSTQFSDKD